MLSLHFVRHGQTDFSKRNCFCGQIDPPLNSTGEAMAAAFAQKWGAAKWAGIVASPLLRTRQTAAATATLAGLTVETDPGLIEIGYGSWEGRSEEEVEKTENEAFHAWARNPGFSSPPGGESAYAIAARALAAVGRIHDKYVDGNILVVSHKATLRVLVCALLGLDVNLFRARVNMPVASLTIIDFKKVGPMLRLLGDTSHLPPELAASEGT